MRGVMMGLSAGLLAVTALVLAWGEGPKPAAGGEAATAIAARPSPPPVAATGRPVGMNLAGMSNASPEYPFLDRFKSFGQWAPEWKPIDPALLDADGWPKRMPANNATINTAIPLDPKPAQYVLTWAGKGDLGFNALNVVSRGNHRIILQSAGDSANIGITASDPTDPIRDIHLVRADQEALFRKGGIFNPAFLEKIKVFSPLRMMDWSCTNGNLTSAWSQRPKVADAAWNCVPLEVQVALANETGADLWINLPALADDDYVSQTITYVRDHLDPAIKLHLEYSNEVWNQGFLQNKQAQAAADRLWGKGQPVANGAGLYYGYRSAQIAATARRLFGATAAARLSPVLATFTWSDDYHVPVFEGVRRAGLGTVGSLFKEYAVTTYFGDALGTMGDPADRPIVLGWARGGAAGMDAAFRQIEHGGGGLKSDFSLDSLRPVYARQAKVAAANGLQLVAYEGGLSGIYYVYENQGAEVADFIRRMKSDPRMGDAYTRMVRDFRAAGGGTVAVFNDVGKTGVFGPWGTLPTIYDTSPAYEALAKLNGR